MGTDAYDRVSRTLILSLSPHFITSLLHPVKPTAQELTYERKQQLKDSLTSGKSLPTELKKQACELGKDLAFDEAQAGCVSAHLLFCCVRILTGCKCNVEPTSHVDSKYSSGYMINPKIILTTSKDLSSKLIVCQGTEEVAVFASVLLAHSHQACPHPLFSHQIPLCFPLRECPQHSIANHIL